MKIQITKDDYTPIAITGDAVSLLCLVFFLAILVAGATGYVGVEL